MANVIIRPQVQRGSGSGSGSKPYRLLLHLPPYGQHGNIGCWINKKEKRIVGTFCAEASFLWVDAQRQSSIRLEGGGDDV